MTSFRRALRVLLAAALSGACLAAWADDAAIRKAWAERYPTLKPIETISKTPVPGLYELRAGADVFYTDENGDHLIVAARQGIEGHLIETKTRADLTQARIDKLLATDIAKLPWKDAVMRKQGSGARRLVVFEDPYCHYCKDVEKSLVALKDVTIYTFIIPILGPDSVARSKDIWCAKDNGRAWQTWMLDGTVPPRPMGQCDLAALDRNLALADKYRVNGTPAIIFDDGSRYAGAAELDKIAKRLDDVAAAAKRG